MANQEHLDILKRGVKVWNAWREIFPKERPDLMKVDLSGADLSGANLSKTDLGQTDLRGADLGQTDLRGADLGHANLRGANLGHANLISAHLFEANLSDADLSYAILSYADLRGAILIRADLFSATLIAVMLDRADFSQATMMSTVLGELDLSMVRGLENVTHFEPSIISIDTIYRSQGKIPEAFLRGAGIPDSFIDNMRSLVGNPIDYHSCFISYSSKDQAFAERLYADLQSNGVRCWLAPHDMRIGDEIRPRIEESIGLYDKLLLVLSENSIISNWVAYEVERALNKESTGFSNFLYPIRLDNTVLASQAGWANDIKSTHHIGDFSNWKNHDVYQKAFSRLMRDLIAGDTESEGR